ncbi:MAG: nucleotidyltransferase family protein [Candidatus Heimdallarchaeaceae archaeon]
MDSIILCGGLGTRIRTVTQDSYPKAMVEIMGKTILAWELSWLRKYNITHAILAVRYLAGYIEEQFGRVYETPYGPIEVSYSKEKEKLGSGGAINLAQSFVSSNNVVIMNGDILTNFNLDELVKHHIGNKEIGTIAVVKMRSPFGIVEIKDDDCISEFREKPTLDHWIHAGIDLFKTDILDRFPKIGQMEETIFVELAKEKQLKAFRVDPKFYWRSIDSPKDLQEADKEWKGIDLK